MSPRFVLVLTVLAVSAFPAATRAQTPQPVYKNVSSEMLERILKDIGIAYKKSAGAKGSVSYEYNREGYTIRLQNYEGKDLWLEALFGDRLALGDVNGWNIRAKFSRCVLLQSAGKSSMSLENQFDCLGGCTDQNVRQFILRFDQELRNFAAYVKNTMPR